jgi:methylenetetrahydrofolate dehydrogenase (NADP+)/methenyltetrahydrofolate cyclohydrolase
LNNDDSVDGIILQLPLPLHLIDKTEEFIEAIRSDKDVDAHTRLNNYSYRHLPTPLITIPVVAAVREFLLEIGEPLQGKDVVVIGRSRYVGTPLALMLSQSTSLAKNDLVSGATVTICHRDTHLNNLTWYCKNADIVISAVGRPSKTPFSFSSKMNRFIFVELVTHRMIKEGAIVIDVGISKSWTDKAVKKNKPFVGDVDFDGRILDISFEFKIKIYLFRSKTCCSMDNSRSRWCWSSDCSLSNIKFIKISSTT